MITMAKFLDDLVRNDFISVYGFCASDISRAAGQKLFPAGWFPYVRDLCAERGVAMPEHLFRWSTVPHKRFWPVIIEQRKAA